jgi:hypothetical protein
VRTPCVMLEGSRPLTDYAYCYGPYGDQKPVPATSDNTL